MEAELRELAALMSDGEIAAARREVIRRRLHKLAARCRAAESPFLTVTEAARRYGIRRRDFARMVEEGKVVSSEICGRVRIDIRQFDGEWL